MLILVDSHTKSGHMVARAANAGGRPLEGQLDFRDGAIITSGPATLDDPPLAWLLEAATLPLVEFRFVFSPPQRLERETAMGVHQLLASVAERMATG